jgi:probable phosphoglycerate mutase
MAAPGHGHRSVVVEADGGSRGNPGNAAYGAVLKDAETGEVIAERAERIGVATNNVAEYRGLIAGLELYAEHADGADLEVRMDSKLVVEQMSGNWRIKHPAMKPLAMQANRLAPFGTVFTWVPREQNKHADRLANEALDGPEGVVIGGPVASAPEDPEADDPLVEVLEAEEPTAPTARTALPTPPWEQGPPTTLVLVRHGDTDHTRARAFSGRTGADPALNDDGRAQVRATGEWLAPLADVAPVLLSSPLRRTRESAEIIGEFLGTSAVVEDGLAEAAFGSWEGLTYQEVLARDPDAFGTWFGDFDQPAGGTGDSMTGMDARVRSTLERVLDRHRGKVVVAVSHLTPIKLLVRQVLDLPMESIFQTETSPASVTVLAWYDDGRSVVRLLNGQPSTHGFGIAPDVR